MSGIAPPGETLSVRIGKQFDRESAGFALHAEFAVPVGLTILFGPSGAGKTTLLDCVAGLVAPDEGRITIGNAVLFDSPSHINVPPNRRFVGYLLQSLALFPHMSVEQNVNYGVAHLSREERERSRREIFQAFRIAELAQRKPDEISGGERQRVALARTLVTRPRVLLLDEPLSALDAATKGRIVDDLRAWNQQHRTPILYVTHNRDEVFALGERALVLEAGQIIAQGLPQDVLRSPQTETVAQLAGFENIFDCTVTSGHPGEGTMTCQIAGLAVSLEVPLARIEDGRRIRVGIRAGDILLASTAPHGLSARNILRGTIVSLRQQDATVIATVLCGVEFIVHLTPGAQHSMRLEPGAPVWMVVKTYSCHVLQ